MDFLSVALPWIGMGLALAVFFTLYDIKEKNKKDKNYDDEEQGISKGK